MSLFEDTNPRSLKELLAEIQRVTGATSAADLEANGEAGA